MAWPSKEYIMEIMNSIGLTLVSFMVLFFAIRQGKLIRIVDKLTDVCGANAKPSVCDSKETNCC